MKIVIGAMDEELACLIADLKAEKIDSLIHEYYVPEKNLVIGITGIGLVNASTALSYLLTKYQEQKIEWIINIGTSGTSERQAKQGGILLINQAVYTLANATGFGYKYGQVPQMPEVYQADQNLIKLIDEKLKKYYVADHEQLVLTTNIGSSDMFVNSIEKSDEFNALLGMEVKAFDMESAALFQTAYRFNLPIAAIKVVSDTFFVKDENEVQFDVFLPIAAKKISQIIQALI